MSKNKKVGVWPPKQACCGKVHYATTKGCPNTTEQASTIQTNTKS